MSLQSQANSFKESLQVNNMQIYNEEMMVNEFLAGEEGNFDFDDSLLSSLSF